MMGNGLEHSKLHVRDMLRTATVGVRTRRMRAALSALGITIGIASLVAVLGLSDSSRSDLLTQLDRLGTNLLVVRGGTGIGLGSGELPDTAPPMTQRIGPVTQVSAVGSVDANVYRTDRIPESRSGGIAVRASDLNLLDTLEGTVAHGQFHDAASAAYPTVVLGSIAAERLGINDVSIRPLVWLGDRWFTVIGILDPLELAGTLDRSAIVGKPAAEAFLAHDGVASSIYLRTEPQWIDEVMSVLPATVNPENPDQVEVSRPTDALEARAAAESAFTALFIGLGIVALIVGGVGIANVMVISVLERRSEIGLRRALGASRRHVAIQFLLEALILALSGGIGGVLLGAGVTALYAQIRGWEILIPTIAVSGGLGAALLIGALAGLYPALRAARLSPTEALHTT
ncbi:MAG: ABC transporter permease [Acidimicrobiia bacterium]|nr:ABC transporter permease [Acidimicrobiia bacterium]MBT8193856.1 ABC transporter permease [Acidimicrobiia bacterium]NNF87023.1 ABC transporter permease [Acidimicrobiia bacterium]NNL14435.1 ABC transporter permease [Acidimicrobiia bacterium]NNL97389.1 ABC transporter permease [Acidimicrobiia bacterium]